MKYKLDLQPLQASMMTQKAMEIHCVINETVYLVLALLSPLAIQRIHRFIHQRIFQEWIEMLSIKETIWILELSPK